MSQQIARYSTFLLSVFVLTLGFGQLLRFDLYGVPIYLHDILIVLILVLNFKRLLFRVWSVEIKVFLLGLAIGWLFALTQYSISDLPTPFLYTLRLLAYLSLYFLIKANRFHIQYSTFLISGLTTLFIGLSQYLLLPDMRWAQYLGWDDHLSRLTLPHFDPTFTAVMLSLFVLSLPYFKSIFHILVLFFSAAAILLTYSRSVWLSLALTFGYFMLKSKNILYLIIGICILVIPISLLPKRFGEGTNLLRTYSISSRISSDLDYIKKYNWTLLVGRGFNTLVLDAPSSSLPNHATGPNNSYLYLLATTGILGLVGWGSLMLKLIRRSTHKPMLIFFFIASLFNNVMFYPFALLWIILIESNQKLM